MKILWQKVMNTKVYGGRMVLSYVRGISSNFCIPSIEIVWSLHKILVIVPGFGCPVYLTEEKKYSSTGYNRENRHYVQYLQVHCTGKIPLPRFDKHNEQWISA